MDITLNKAQLNVIKEARKFLKKECPSEFVREMFEDQKGYTDELWDKIVQMDWTAISIPEEYGGMGMALLDLVLILEETGRVLLPGPFLSTVSLFAEALVVAGSDKQKGFFLSKVADGSIKGTLALFEPDGGSNPGYIQTSANPEGDSFILNGTKLMVPDAHVADYLICAARTRPGASLEEGITLFILPADTPGMEITVHPTMDSIRKYSQIEMRQVTIHRDQILGELDNGWEALDKAMQRSQVAICAESVGGAQWAMESATEYAKNRIQFGQPIGAFQAVKHRCAQMFADVESSRSILYYAAWAQDHEEPTAASIAASAAKAYCSEAFTRVTCDNVQVLGGAGFVWEDDIHLYLKRAKANEIALGDPDYHRDRLVDLLP